MDIELHSYAFKVLKEGDVFLYKYTAGELSETALYVAIVTYADDVSLMFDDLDVIGNDYGTTVSTEIEINFDSKDDDNGDFEFIEVLFKHKTALEEVREKYPEYSV